MSRIRTTVGLVATAAAVAVSSTAFAAAPGPKITSLKSSQSGSKVTVTIRTAYFTIDAKDVGKKPIAGKGHEHFAMDHGKFDHPKYSGANGKLAKQLGVDGMYSPSVTNKVTYTGLPKGKHTITVFLVKNDHSNYAGAKKTLTINVK